MGIDYVNSNKRDHLFHLTTKSPPLRDLRLSNVTNEFIQPNNQLQLPTRILMSFAMANHGANFANWLRDKLMKQYNLYHVNAVYVDSVVARSGETRHTATKFKPTDIAHFGMASVSPDRRPHMLSPTTAMPIGAQREDWNILYKKAMSEAEAMVFAYTNEYKDSLWCMQEWGQFHLENEQRRHRGQPLLRGIFLAFNDDKNLVGINQPHITHIAVEKTDSLKQGLAWDQDDFVLSAKNLQRVIAEIGPLKPSAALIETNDVKRNDGVGQIYAAV